jgi:hypothetical protein
MKKDKKLSLSIIGNRFLAGLMIFVICIGCMSPRINLVEIKASVITAGIFEKQPFLRHYFDIIRFSEYIVTSFYVGESIRRGESPRPHKKTFPEKQQQPNDWAATGYIMLVKPKLDYNFETKFDVFKNFKADYTRHLYVTAGINHQSIYFWSMMMAFDILLLLVMCLLVLPRRGIADSILLINKKE